MDNRKPDYFPPPPYTAYDGNNVPTNASNYYNPCESGPSLPPHSMTGRPNLSSTEANLITRAELERRQRELNVLAAELAKREEEERLKDLNLVANFPPLPKFFPCSPCFYQDIQSEIPSEYQNVVTMGYRIWLVYSTLLLINILITLMFLCLEERIYYASQFVFAIFIFIIFVPVSYICWFRALYNAFKTFSSVKFFFFFLNFGIQILYLILTCTGAFRWGACGWFTAVWVIRVNVVIGIFGFILAALFTALTVACIVFIIYVHSIYRKTGATFEEAKQQLRGVNFIM